MGSHPWKRLAEDYTQSVNACIVVLEEWEGQGKSKSRKIKDIQGGPGWGEGGGGGGEVPVQDERPYFA